MKWTGINVVSTGSFLPEGRETVDEAIAQGRFDPQVRDVHGFRAVAVAEPAQTGPVMAAAAAREAAGRGDVEEADIVLHASMSFPGQDFWTPAHFVQGQSVGGHGLAVDVAQGSNGGLTAVELAASFLAARPAARHALVTTGDVFALPHFDRWRSDSQQAYGDGASAICLSTGPGFAALRSTHSISDPSLEPVYRGSSWAGAPFENGEVADLDARKNAYLASVEGGFEGVLKRMTRNAQDALDGALADAGISMDGVDHFVHANVSESIVQFSFHGLLGIDRAATPYDWGLGIGHVGAGDHLLGLDRLASTGRLRGGDTVVMMGVGAGFMWSATVLEVTASPGWAPTTGAR